MTLPPDETPAGHVPISDIAAFVARLLSQQRQEEVIAHLAECDRCRTLVAEYQRSHEFTRDPDCHSG